MKCILSFLILTLILSCKPTENKTQLSAENIALKERIRILEASDTLHTEAAVELKKMNVVYRGVSNPIYISKPNALSFEAIAAGLTKKDSLGNYNLNVGLGNTIDIKIKSHLKNGDHFTEVKTLRIKDIQAPTGKINGIGCGLKCEVLLSKDELKNGKISVKIEDFLFDFAIPITSFKLNLPQLKSIKIEGNKIDSKTKDLIDLLSVNDQVQIYDIKIYFKGMSNYRLKGISPILIRLID